MPKPGTMKNRIIKFNKTACSKDGFSLVEVLIAMAVLSIGLLAIAAMQTSAIKGNATSNNLTLRTTSASNYIENLLNIPFNDARLTAGGHNPENDGVDNDGDGVIDGPGDDGDWGYSITWNVTDDNSNQKTITLTLAGRYYGTARTLVMTTVRIR